MSPAEEAATAAILILRTVLKGDTLDDRVILLQNGTSREAVSPAAAAERIATAPSPLSLRGERVGKRLRITLELPSPAALRFLELRKEKSGGLEEFLGAVPMRHLRQDGGVQVVGRESLRMTAEGYIHLHTNFFILPHYSLSGYAPESTGKDSSNCWNVKVGSGAIGIAFPISLSDAMLSVAGSVLRRLGLSRAR